jgi:hypothetical protein
MKSAHPIAFLAAVPAANDADAIALTIARLREENEALRRLVVSLSAQLGLAQDAASLDDHQHRSN